MSSQDTNPVIAAQNNTTVTTPSEDGEDNYYYWEGEDGKIYRFLRTPGDDRARGVCSGIPSCCIDFFIGRWNEMKASERRLYRHKMNTIKKSMQVKMNYIPCPNCLDIRFIAKVKSCDSDACTCGQYQLREQVD